MTELSIPQKREAEEAVLGSVLINPEAFHDTSVILSADDFYCDRHKWIWQAFTRLVGKQAPLDLLTVTNELDGMGRLAEIGGPAYLTGLINQSPTSLNAEAYARIVLEQAIRRRMIQSANRIAALGYGEHIPLESAIDQAWTDLEAATTTQESRVREIGPIMSDAYDRVNEISQLPPDQRPFLDTGLLDLDRLLRIRPQNLITIAGRPGMGKTGLAMTIALHTAVQRGKTVAIFELEMSAGELADRLAAQQGNINLTHITDGTLTADEWDRYTQAIETISASKILINDNADMTLPQLRSWCQKIKLRRGLDLVIVDYLGLMDGVGENRERQVAYISRGLKKMAKALDIPVIALQQMNRAIEQRGDGEPIPSDLRDSGSIEQDSDAVLFLYTTEEPVASDPIQVIKASLPKQRSGPKGKCQLAFRPTTTKFENAA
jgi:replicative DNA helicase